MWSMQGTGGADRGAGDSPAGRRTTEMLILVQYLRDPHRARTAVLVAYKRSTEQQIPSIQLAVQRYLVRITV